MKQNWLFASHFLHRAEDSRVPYPYRCNWAHKLPGQVKHATISLKRGITQDAELWEWRRKARDGKIERKNGSIVLLDANQIQQAFMNILLNAADAMPSGGILTLTSRLLPGDGFVEIRFADTGLGISEENLDKVFDPFFTTKAHKRGTGLGLAVSYGVIERHRAVPRPIFPARRQRVSVQHQVGCRQSRQLGVIRLGPG